MSDDANLKPVETPSDGNPNLQAVPDPSDASASPAPAEPVASEKKSNFLPWLLAGAAVVFALLWLSQVQQTQALEGRVVALEGELTGARQALDAYGARMGAVRGQVGEILQGMQALEALVSEDPAAVVGSAAEAAPIDEGSAL